MRLTESGSVKLLCSHLVSKLHSFEIKLPYDIIGLDVPVVAVHDSVLSFSLLFFLFFLFFFLLFLLLAVIDRYIASLSSRCGI